MDRHPAESERRALHQKTPSTHCVKAAVELREGFAASGDLESEILDFARERLARYKVPRTIDFEDTLPRESTGKLYIRRLRDRYWKGRGRRI